MIRRLIALNVLWGGLLMAQPPAVCIEDKRSPDAPKSITCHVRRPLTEKELSRVSEMEGVEIVYQKRRYGFAVQVAELHSLEEVAAAIVKELSK